MRVTTSKSKNPESFYITKPYTNAQGKSTSTTIKKLGPLAVGYLLYIDSSNLNRSLIRTQHPYRQFD